MIHSISEAELDTLSLDSLVRRMDEFLLQTHRERYDNFPEIFPIAVPSELIHSISVRQRPDVEIRRIAYICFSYLVQLQLDSVSSGFANRLLYTEDYKLSDWGSPVFRLRNSAIQQYQIICSRIAFEIFIDLLYAIETGQRIESKKSKLKAFRTWLSDAQNKFHYFAHVLLAAYRFDRQVRTPEVHGTSRLPRRMLLLQVPSFEENNQHLQLTNTLAGVWKPLIDILNNVRPNYMNVSQADKEWFHTYMSGDDDAIEAKLNEMLSALP